MYTNDLSDGALSRIGIYVDDTTASSSIQTSDFFDRLEMTAEFEEDLRCTVKCTCTVKCGVIQCYQDDIAVF